MKTTLSRYVSGQLRAELARREMPHSELARLLGTNDMWVSRRARGRVRMSLDDIERVAMALDVPTSFFTERPAA